MRAAWPGRLLVAQYLAFLAVSVCEAADPGGQPCRIAGDGSMLARAATGLAAGRWCHFDAAEADGLAELLAVAPGDENNYINWQHGAQWDPVNRLWLFHGYDYAPVSAAMVVYDETENTWRVSRDRPFAPGGNGHDYDQTVVDPETGIAYFRPRLSNTVWLGEWNRELARHEWSDERVAPLGRSCPSQSNMEANGMAWDGRRKGIVMLSAAEGGVVCFWDRDRNRWSVDGRVTISTGYHQSAEWDPVNGLVWLTDYLSTTHWTNLDGRVSKNSTAAPYGLGCCGSSGAVISADPQSGRFVVTRQLEQGRVWDEYDASRDAWSAIEHSMPPIGGSVTALGGPVDDYGLIMYLAWNDGDPQLFLYRHAVSR